MLTVAALAKALQTRLPAPTGGLVVDFGDYAVRVETNSDELLKKLARYFRDFAAPEGRVPDAVVTALESADPVDVGLDFTVKTPDPGKHKIKEEFLDLADGRVVRKRLTGVHFLFGDGVNLAVGPVTENDNQVVNFINNRFIEWTLVGGCLLFHAAGIAVEGRGLALAGFSGMGKSTLALAALNHGCDFVGNDRLMIRRDGDGLVMYGPAKMPRINPGTVLNNPSLASVMTPEEAETFRKLPLEELWNLEHKYDAFIDDCFGPGRFKPVSTMRGLVLLNWRRTEEPVAMTRIDLSARRDLMPAFMKAAGLFYRPDALAHPDPGEAAYLELLADCPVYELTGGADFDRAATLCLDLIRDGRA